MVDCLLHFSALKAIMQLSPAGSITRPALRSGGARWNYSAHLPNFLPNELAHSPNSFADYLIYARCTLISTTLLTPVGPGSLHANTWIFPL
jgi:hypothetical protein